MRQVIDEGRNAVRGLRSSRTATLDLETGVFPDCAGIQVSDEVEFRVIVDGRARPLNPAVRTTFIESAGKLWSTRFGIPTQKRSIWKFNTLPSKCAYWYGTTDAGSTFTCWSPAGRATGVCRGCGNEQKKIGAHLRVGAECPAERKWNSLSRLRLLSATCRQIDGANCSLRHLGSKPFTKTTGEPICDCLIGAAELIRPKGRRIQVMIGAFKFHEIRALVISPRNLELQSFFEPEPAKDRDIHLLQSWGINQVTGRIAFGAAVGALKNRGAEPCGGDLPSRTIRGQYSIADNVATVRGVPVYVVILPGWCRLEAVRSSPLR